MTSTFLWYDKDTVHPTFTLKLIVHMTSIISSKSNHQIPKPKFPFSQFLAKKFKSGFQINLKLVKDAKSYIHAVFPTQNARKDVFEYF